MDSLDSIHLSDLLSDPPLWNGEARRSWSSLLASCYPCFKQGYYHGIRYESNYYFRHDHVIARWCKNYRCQHAKQRGSWTFLSFIKTIWSPYYFRRSSCLFVVRNVWTSWWAWIYSLFPYYWSTLPCRLYGAHARWITPKRIWTWIWYFFVHCYQYLWKHSLEVFLPCYYSYWSGNWVWRLHHRSLPLLTY